MSYVIAAPELLMTAAAELGALESTLSAASVVAAQSITSLMAAAADEVSTAVAVFFELYGREFQAIKSQAAQFHRKFAGNLAASADAYFSADIVLAEQILTGTGTGLPSAAAGVRLTVPGAGPLYSPDFLLRLPYLGQVFLIGGIPGPVSATLAQGYDLLNHAIGGKWFPGNVAHVIDYPASMGLVTGSLAAPGVDQAVAIGQAALHAQIMSAAGTGSPVQIAGLSMGTLVVNRELAYLATDPSAPPAHALQFALFSSPELGFAHVYLPTGTMLPLLGYTMHGLVNTQYDVSVVFGQYDIFGNPPDRPWNLPAVVNSLFGTVYNHHPAALVSASDAVELSSVTTPRGGTVTTYMVPSPTLPMLMPLAQLGVPEPIVSGLNSLLKPIVDAGYSSLTPDAGPYFSQGTLVGLPTAGDVVDTITRWVPMPA